MYNYKLVKVYSYKKIKQIRSNATNILKRKNRKPSTKTKPKMETKTKSNILKQNL